MNGPPSLLVADDDPVARDVLAEVLVRQGYRVRTASGGAECIRLAEAESCDLALVDLRMPDLDGLEVLNRLRTLEPAPLVLILTAFATVDTAIDAIRAGAYDYLSKPFRIEEITVVVRRALEAQRLLRENARYREELRDRHRVENLVGRSPQMVEIYKLMARVAALDTTVLLQGETGTGKEVVARAIHHASRRAGRPFSVIDCTSLPEGLFESEIFGHERGAFTGAVAARRGLFESADGGTCFLDEISELSSALQAKLLRVLQERSIRRVGGNDQVPVDIRVIAATNRDLHKQVEAGAFREDLYYRLNVVTLTMPPLRERRDDIPLLSQHFLAKYARAAGRPTAAFARETLALLGAYGWPGNVRELEHVIERAVALSVSALVLPQDLPEHVRAEPPRSLAALERNMTLEDVKHWYVTRVLEDVGGNKLRAAEVLGIDRGTIYRILERQPPSHEDDA
jgi:two-component system response regulator AtoC